AAPPEPGKLAEQLGQLAATSAVASATASGEPASAPAARIDWRELCDQVDRAGMLRVAGTMRDWLRVIDLAPGHLVYALAPGYSDDPAAELRDALLKATRELWQGERGEGEGAPTLREQAEAARRSRRTA